MLVMISQRGDEEARAADDAAGKTVGRAGEA